VRLAGIAGLVISEEKYLLLGGEFLSGHVIAPKILIPWALHFRDVNRFEALHMRTAPIACPGLVTL
jgi:hypothetical protein